MSAPSPLVVTSLDFDGIKSNFIQFLQSQTTFSDYNFAGAGFTVLLDILSYNTYYGGYFVNMLASETGIETAVIRDNLNKIAKALNYTPRSMICSTAFVNLTVTPPAGNTPVSSLSLPAYTSFLSQAINGVNYTYSTTSPQNASLSANGNYLFSNIAISEGDVVNFIYTANTTNPRNQYNIPSANIDTTTLVVNVTENSLVPPQTFPYTLCTDVSLLTGNSQVYFLDGGDNSTYNLYFGDGILGRSLLPGDTVYLTYLNTNGDTPNQANNFTIISPIGGYGNVITSSISAASGGAQAETNDSIRLNAPLAYTTQERAVTLDDYLFLLGRDYQNIGSIAAWGGDKNNPPVYNSIFLAIKPLFGSYLTNIQKNQIMQILQKYNLPTTNIQIVNPDFTYLVVTSNVNYNPNATNLTTSQLQQEITNAILGYNSTNLGKFTSTFRGSNLSDAIEAVDPSILGVDNTIFLQKRFFPNLTQPSSYTLNYYTALQQGTLTSLPGISIFDNNGNLQQAALEENVNTFKGITGYQVVNPGFGFTDTPNITITGDGSGASAQAIIVNGSISQVIPINNGENYNITNVQISGGGGYGAEVIPILSNSTAVLDTYYFSNSTKLYITTNQGNINYPSGVVTLNNFNPNNILNAAQQLSINVQPASQFVFPSLQNILTIDPTDPLAISVNLIPQPS